MKVLAIIGTGFKNGTVDKMTQAILQGAQSADHETESIYLSDYQVSPCLGCFQCLGDSPCKIKDDFHKLYKKCTEADVLILSTPIYMGNVSGLMKNFFDRHNGDAMYNPPLMGQLKNYPKKDRQKLFFKEISKEYAPMAEIQKNRVIRVVAANKPFFLLLLTGELRTTYHGLASYISEMKCTLYKTILYSGTQFNPEKENKILRKAYKIGAGIK